LTLDKLSTSSSGNWKKRIVGLDLRNLFYKNN
jgi:hypothetical protein